MWINSLGLICKKVRDNVTINNLFTRSSSTLTFSWRWKPGLWSDMGSTSTIVQTATSEEEMLHIFISLQERRLCYVVKMERSTWERCVCTENYTSSFLSDTSTHSHLTVTCVDWDSDRSVSGRVKAFLFKEPMKSEWPLALIIFMQAYLLSGDKTHFYIHKRSKVRGWYNFILFLKEVSCAHQGCVYLIKNTLIL